MNTDFNLSAETYNILLKYSYSEARGSITPPKRKVISLMNDLADLRRKNPYSPFYSMLYYISEN